MSSQSDHCISQSNCCLQNHVVLTGEISHIWIIAIEKQWLQSLQIVKNIKMYRVNLGQLLCSVVRFNIHTCKKVFWSDFNVIWYWPWSKMVGVDDSATVEELRPLIPKVLGSNLVISWLCLFGFFHTNGVSNGYVSRKPTSSMITILKLVLQSK